MNDRTDKQLLRDYAEKRSEAAFAELVGRHVDAVYSAALRMVRDPHLANDVTQNTFIRLAQQSPTLVDRDVLSGWLHTVAHNLAANVVRAEVRRREREQKAAAMHDVNPNENDAGALWDRISLDVDAALHQLTDADRDALTLRFFERKSAREIARILNVTEDTAQKRVTRAIERLRERLSQRGVTATVAVLTAALSTQVVQAAPIALTAALTTTTTFSIATAATKTIAMTTLQKTTIAAALALSIGTGVYEFNRAAAAQRQVQTIQQQTAPLAEQLQQVQTENARVAGLVATLQNQNDQLQQQLAELPRLRAEVTRLRSSPAGFAKASGADPTDPAVKNFLMMREQAQKIAQYFEAMPEKKIPELSLLSDVDWLAAVKEANFDSDANIRKALSQLRHLSKNRLPMSQALDAYLEQNSDVLPSDLAQLKPYLEHALYPKTVSSDALDQILSRYTLAKAGKVSDHPPGSWFIVEKQAVDKEYDTRAKFGKGISTMVGTGSNEAGETDY